MPNTVNTPTIEHLVQLTKTWVYAYQEGHLDELLKETVIEIHSETELILFARIGYAFREHVTEYEAFLQRVVTHFENQKWDKHKLVGLI